MNNCDEFIFYDDLVRATAAPARRRRPAKKKAAEKPEAKGEEKPADKSAGKKKVASPADIVREAGKDSGGEADRQDEAIELVVETAEALVDERGGQVWGSMVKQTLKRRNPGFNESYYGFRAFSDLLEAAEERGLLDLEMDERSGGYVIKAVRLEN
jgi:hypothetical protein